MIRRLFTLTTALVLVGACTDAPVAPSVQRLAASAAHTGQSIWAEEITGETGPGSLYGINMPVNWNGSVVYYAHGFVDVAAPVALPTTQDQFGTVRDALGALGYAVAYSSFSSNGYAFAEGLRRTHQLAGLFRSQFGKPQYSYLAGHSLGAEISLALAERYGQQYDGALLMCGLIGGAEAHMNWLGNVRLLFDFFYPGVLPGDVTSVPTNINLNNDIIIPALTAINANPVPVFLINAVDQTPLAGLAPNEWAQSLITAVAWHARGVNDIVGRSHGHLPFENAGTTYTDLVPLTGVPANVLAAINLLIPRYDAPRDAEAWREHNFQPSGDVSFPILTVHTTQDPSIPFFHETLFGQLVNTAGTQDLVVQRPINRYGHCAFTVDEMLTAFQDLVNWVRNDVTPTP